MRNIFNTIGLIIAGCLGGAVFWLLTNVALKTNTTSAIDLDYQMPRLGDFKFNYSLSDRRVEREIKKNQKAEVAQKSARKKVAPPELPKTAAKKTKVAPKAAQKKRTTSEPFIEKAKAKPIENKKFDEVVQVTISDINTANVFTKTEPIRPPNVLDKNTRAQISDWVGKLADDPSVETAKDLLDAARNGEVSRAVVTQTAKNLLGRTDPSGHMAAVYLYAATPSANSFRQLVAAKQSPNQSVRVYAQRAIESYSDIGKRVFVLEILTDAKKDPIATYEAVGLIDRQHKGDKSYSIFVSALTRLGSDTTIPWRQSAASLADEIRSN